MRPWVKLPYRFMGAHAFVGKKMKEYLGEEEPELVELIIGKLQARATPSVIEADLTQILDDEAAVFVVKLWRMLLFEIKAKQAGHQT